MNNKLDKAISDLREKDDRHIHNIVANSWENELYLEAAKIVYKERNLDSSEKQNLIQNYQHYLDEALLKLDLGLTIDEAKQYLVNKGMEPQHAETHLRSRIEKKKEKGKIRTQQIFTVLFILFLIKMIYRYFW